MANLFKRIWLLLAASSLLQHLTYVGGRLSAFPERRLSKRREVTMEELLDSKKLFMKHVGYCEQLNLLVCAATAAGSSEMLGWLSRLCDKPNPPVTRPSIDKRSPMLKKVWRLGSNEKIKDWMETWTIIKIGRDPWSRAVSSFYSTFNNEPLSKHGWACEVAKKVRGPIDCSMSAAEALTFEEFVDYLSVTDNTMKGDFADLSSQLTTCPMWMAADYQLQVTELPEKLPDIAVDLGGEPADAEFDEIDDDVLSLRVKEHYCASPTGANLIEAISTRYADDIEYFGFHPPCDTEAAGNELDVPNAAYGEDAMDDTVTPTDAEETALKEGITIHSDGQVQHPRDISMSQLEEAKILLQKYAGYCEKHKLIVCSAAGAASSELLKWISRVCENPQPPITRPSVDRRTPRLKKGWKKDNNEAVLDWFKDWTIVHVTRDPWGRAVSTYYSKFHEQPLNPGTLPCKAADKVRDGTSSCGPMEQPITFDEFLTVLTSTVDASSGDFETLFSQVSTCPPWLQPDYSFHHDRIVEELTLISEENNLDVAHIDTKPGSDIIHMKNLVKEHVMKNCTVRNLIRDRYQKDMDQYGYKTPICYASSDQNFLSEEEPEDALQADEGIDAEDFTEEQLEDEDENIDEATSFADRDADDTEDEEKEVTLSIENIEEAASVANEDADETPEEEKEVALSIETKFAAQEESLSSTGVEIRSGDEMEVTYGAESEAPVNLEVEKPRSMRTERLLTAKPLLKKRVSFCEEKRLLVCSPAGVEMTDEVISWTAGMCGEGTIGLGGALLQSVWSGSNIKQIKDWFKTFTVVTVSRNPFERLLLSYHSYFQNIAPTKPFVCEVAKRVRGEMAGCEESDPPLTFNEILDFVVNHEDSADEFEPFSNQVMTCPDWLLPDYKIKYANLETLNVLGDELGGKPNLKVEMEPRLTQAIQKYFASNCTAVEAVQRRYSADMEAFGYEPPVCQDA